jgi:hypothetical protein
MGGLRVIHRDVSVVEMPPATRKSAGNVAKKVRYV